MNPDCSASLLIGDTFTGELAHIAGERPGSERYDASMTDAQRNAPPNLIALCPSCHVMIDKPGAAGTFPTPLLLSWHSERSAVVRRATRLGMKDVVSQELRIVVTGLLNAAFAQPQHAGPLTLVPTAAKIRVNQLSGDTEAAISVSMSRFAELESVLQSVNKLDPQATAKLTEAVVREYEEQALSSQGDALFDDMVSWACRGNRFAPQSRAAATVVIAYFFERCDIFERA